MAIRVSSEEAISAIKPGSSIVFPPGCGETQTLIEALAKDSERLEGTRLFSGLLLTDYKFLQPPCRGKFKYYTWHVTRRVRDLVAGGAAEFLPARSSQVPKILERLGVDVAFIHVSPPDSGGYCSLGVSASYSLSAARQAKTVIAEVNDRMPRTLGECFIHLSEIDYLVEISRPLVAYHSPNPDAVSRKICSYIAELIPDGSVVQIGFGSIPESVTSFLKDSGLRVSVCGMGVDAMVDLAGAGMLAPFPGKGACSVISGELMGTEKLFNFAHDNPILEMHPASFAANPVTMGKFKNFISINSAVQVDLWGQANSEAVGDLQISGVGGCFDFIEGALMSPGGKTILAIPSTNGPNGQSTIVPRLPPGTPVTAPRHSVQYVVTEYGVADLTAKSLNERAEALIAIAHPEWRDRLWNEYAGLSKLFK
ncbi:MAG: acetyl-CoA hydrolase/transferase family protein [Bacillota bacterium]